MSFCQAVTLKSLLPKVIGIANLRLAATTPDLNIGQLISLFALLLFVKKPFFSLAPLPYYTHNYPLTIPYRDTG